MLPSSATCLEWPGVQEKELFSLNYNSGCQPLCKACSRECQGCIQTHSPAASVQGWGWGGGLGSRRQHGPGMADVAINSYPGAAWRDLVEKGGGGTQPPSSSQQLGKRLWLQSIFNSLKAFRNFGPSCLPPPPPPRTPLRFPVEPLLQLWSLWRRPGDEQGRNAVYFGRCQGSLGPS